MRVARGAQQRGAAALAGRLEQPRALRVVGALEQLLHEVVAERVRHQVAQGGDGLWEQRLDRPGAALVELALQEAAAVLVARDGEHLAQDLLERRVALTLLLLLLLQRVLRVVVLRGVVRVVVQRGGGAVVRGVVARVVRVMVVPVALPPVIVVIVVEAIGRKRLPPPPPRLPWRIRPGGGGPPPPPRGLERSSGSSEDGRWKPRSLPRSPLSLPPPRWPPPPPP